MKGFVVAGTQSGSGKTTVSLALMAWFKKKGLRVAPFKVGPDFIDPGHHTRITGVVSRNLDGWMLSKEYNRMCFEKHTAGADIAIVEGVMGLFDGYSGTSEEGSTAQMAKWNDLPVILVVNAKSMARSAAALVRGFEHFDTSLKFAGVIFNNVGSERHLDYLREAMEGHSALPVLGGIFRNNDIAIPERHLGLVTDSEHVLTDKDIDTLAGLIEDSIDTEALLEKAKEFETGKPAKLPAKTSGKTIRIGVAKDKAFCFYYMDNLEILESYGAEIVYFSPIEETCLPGDIHGLYFGGGYPELFAEKLSSNTSLLEDVNQMSRSGLPIYGECGGFMYLSRDITDHDGTTHLMTDCLPFSLKMLTKLKALGYREVLLRKDTVIGEKGMTVRGHEFHYSEIMSSYETSETVYSVQKRVINSAVNEGFVVDKTLGSYVHLHFGSNPDVGKHFVAACRNYKKTLEK